MIDIKKEIKKVKRNYRVLLVLIVFACLLMSIGYASINSISSEIEGDVTALVDQGLNIVSVDLSSSTSVDLDNTSVNSYFNTTMGGVVTLSSSDASVTYSVTICNVSTDTYTFKSVVYDGSFYDNENIVYTLEDLDKGTTIAPGESITFTITFSYLDDTLTENNTLNYTIKFKFFSNTAVDTIVSLVDGVSSDSSGVITVDSSDSTCTNTFAYDATSDNNLRYVGSNPCNYVSFNDELYRIIGVMNNVDDGTGYKETRVKIIRMTTVGNYAFDLKGYGVGSKVDYGSYYGSNDYSDSQLMMMLNTSVGYNFPSGYTKANKIVYDSNNKIVYQEGCIPYYIESSATSYYCESASYSLSSEAQSLISDAVWNLGGSSNHQNATPAIFYTRERGSEVYGTHATTWTGKVGLMYPSDYGFATSGGSTTDRSTCLSKYLYNWNSNTDCRNNDWLYAGESTNAWTITPGTAADRAVYLNFYSGKTSWAYASKSTYDGSVGSSLKNSDVFPTVYLSSDVVITEGNGSSTSPYELAI